MEIDPTLVQALFTIIIAMATTIYVIKTADIANATKKQAEISEKLQEISQNQTDILEKQSINVDRPILTIDIEEGTILKESCDITYSFHNIGTGPALAIRCFFGYSETTSTYGYDPRELISTSESVIDYLPLGKDRSSRHNDTIGSAIAKGLFCKGMSSHSAILYIYCFYENIFRSRYKSIYPVELSLDIVDTEKCVIGNVKYLKPLIRPLNKYESMLEDMERKSVSP